MTSMPTRSTGSTASSLAHGATTASARVAATIAASAQRSSGAGSKGVGAAGAASSAATGATSASTSSGASTDLSFLKRLAGRFIVFEGPDGSGKSTQMRRLLAACRERSIDTCEVREPGGTPVGERIRQVLLERVQAGMEMGVRCEALLYMASRAELVERTILPSLIAGKLVLADRFVSSTLAYQGSAGGLAAADIAAVARIATRNLQPDLIIVFDIDEVAAAKRLSPLLDRMEAKGAAFHRAVRQGYLEQAKGDPGRYVVVDASRAEDDVWASLMQRLFERVDRLPPLAPRPGKNP
jgi:dTMP kinase